MKVLATILVLTSVPLASSSQVWPKENARLNYRIIGFSFPATEHAVKYKIEIAYELCNDEATFRPRVISSATGKNNRIIAEVPAFGRAYTWRYISTSAAKKISKSPFYHFSTDITDVVDTCSRRLKITKAAQKYKDCYVFVDANKALYDMKGNPVWYIPVKPDIPGGKFTFIRDLKLSPRGTITCLVDQQPYELNYNGDTLWAAPFAGVVNGEDSEQFHHEFTRLSNGHYMVLGTEHARLERKMLPGKDSSIYEQPDVTKSDSFVTLPQKTAFGTIIEYDEKGQIVWYWKSSRYFTGSDIIYYTPQLRLKPIDVHENCFSFDEPDSIIYIGFKNISRILKVRYPQGNVVGSYGETYSLAEPMDSPKLFCEPHGIRHAPKKRLYMFNNDPCQGMEYRPKVVEFEEAGVNNDTLKKIWEYECATTGAHINPASKKFRDRERERVQKSLLRAGEVRSLRPETIGGNVVELPDHSFFVCMNTQYARIFIVGRDKKIVWNAVPEKWNPPENDWFQSMMQYRASIITRKELESLIWNSSKYN